MDEGNPLPLVDGLLEESISPQVTEARAAFVFKALEVIEGELGRRVDYLRVNEEGELLVSFPPQGFVAVFSGKDGDIEVLGREVRRLRAVLGQFRGGEERLKRVDLAFERVAVVKTED